MSDAIDYFSICDCGKRYKIKESTAPHSKGIYCSAECRDKDLGLSVMSDDEKAVKKVYPDAQLMRHSRGYAIYPHMGICEFALEYSQPTEKDAWASARSRLPVAQPEEITIEEPKK